jgi:hypothetical protein
LTRTQTNACAQCHDRIQHGAGRAGQRAVDIESERISRASSPPQEARAIGFTRYFTDALPAGGYHMHADERALV